MSRDGLYGSYDESTGKATGIIKEISSGVADFAVDVIEDTARRKAVEFTTPYEVTHYGIAYVYNHQHMRSGVFSPFSGTLWLTIFAVFFGMILFLWAFEKTSCIQKSRPTSECREVFNIFDSMEYIWGTMSHGEIILNKPIGVGGRLMSVFASFSLIAVVACYSAELISSFVVTDDTPLITGLKDILVRTPTLFIRGGFRHCGARGQRPLEALDVTIFDVIYTVFCIFFSFAGPFLVKKSARPGAMAPLAPT